MTIIIKDLLATVLLALTYAVTGYLILFYKGSFKKAPLNFRVIFLSFFTGLIFLISLYAIWFTHGKTIQIILLPFVGYLVYVIRKQDHPFIRREYSPYFILSIFLLFILVFFGYSYWEDGNNYNINDYILYTKISYYMPRTGCENDYHFYNTLDADYRAATPYHYFDLWLNSISCSVLPSGLRYDTFILVTPTILLLAIFFAFLAIYETHKKVDQMGLLLSFSVIFTAGIFFPFYHKVPLLDSFEYCFTPFSKIYLVKFAPTVLFLAASYIILTNLNLLGALLTMGMVGVIAIVNLPSIGFAFVLTFLFFQVFRKRLELNFSWKYLCIALAPLLAVASFYAILGNHHVVRGGVSGPEIIQQLHGLMRPQFLKSLINIIGSSVINIAVVYLLFIPIVVFAFYKLQAQKGNNVFYLIIMLGFCLGGIISWGFLSPKCNSIQPFYFTLRSLPILIFISLLLIDSHWLKYATICIVFVLAALNIYKDVDHNAKDQSKKLCLAEYDFAKKHMDLLSRTACIQDSSEYTSVFDYYSICFTLGRYVGIENDSFFPISMSDCSLPFEKDSATRLLNLEGARLGVFYRFVEKQKIAGTFSSVAESQIDFIKKYHVRNIILSAKAKLPPAIKALSDSTEAVVPEIGERIVRLKY